MTGTEIYKARKARGWTQAELAAKAGTTVTTISRIETNSVKKPMPLTMAAIERALREGQNAD